MSASSGHTPETHRVAAGWRACCRVAAIAGLVMRPGPTESRRPLHLTLDSRQPQATSAMTTTSTVPL